MGWAGEGQGLNGVKLCRDCEHAAVNSREPEGLQLPCAEVPEALTLHAARLDVCKGSLWRRVAPRMIDPGGCAPPIQQG